MTLLAIMAAAVVPLASLTVHSTTTDASNADALCQWYAEGACLVKERPVEARKLLGTPPESMDFLKSFVKAATGTNCFQNEVEGTAPKMHPNATRGAVVEALFAADFSAIGQARGTLYAKIFDLDAPYEATGADLGQIRARAFLKLGECVASRQPTDTVSVFRTRVASGEESAAVRLLTSSISECMPPDLTLKIVPSMFRSYLVEGAYRVSIAQLGRAGS